jgi:hypothetical protein
VILAAAIAFMASAPTGFGAAFVAADEIVLDGPELRVADLVRLDRADPEIAGRVIARMPAGRSILVLEEEAVANLLERAVPGLGIADVQAGRTIRIRIVPRAPRLRDGCLVTNAAVARGAAITARSIAPATCDPARDPASVRFDTRTGSLRAAAPLAAGAYLGRTAVPADIAIEPGARVTLVSSVGPVRIERAVTALQPGRPGRSLFVRDADGEVFAAPLAAGEDARR